MLSGACVAALGQPILLTGIIGLTRGYLRPEHRPAGIAAATAATWAGFVGAFALSAAFSDASSLPNLVAAHAAYAVAAAIALAIALRTPAPFANPRDQHRSARQPGRGPRRVERLPVRRLCLFAFIPFGTFIALTTWTQALLEPADVTVDQVGVILICCVLAGVVGTAVIPVVAVRRRREVRAGVIATVVTTMACVLLAAAPGFGMGLVCLSARRSAPAADARHHPRARRTAHRRDTDGISSGLVWTLGTSAASSSPASSVSPSTGALTVGDQHVSYTREPFDGTGN